MGPCVLYFVNFSCFRLANKTSFAKSITHEIKIRLYDQSHNPQSKQTVVMHEMIFGASGIDPNLATEHFFLYHRTLLPHLYIHVSILRILLCTATKDFCAHVLSLSPIGLGLIDNYGLKLDDFVAPDQRCPPHLSLVCVSPPAKNLILCVCLTFFFLFFVGRALKREKWGCSRLMSR